MEEKIRNVIVIILLLSFVTIVAAASFSEDNVGSWSEDLTKLKAVSIEKKQSAWSTTDVEQRNEVVNGIVKKSRDGGLVSSILNVFTGGKGDKTEVELVGFSSDKLKWKNELSLSDGNVEINLEDIPTGVSKINYDEESGKITYEFKAGQKIEIAKGLLKADMEYIPEDGEEDNLRKTYFKLGKEGKISVDKDGTFKISGEKSNVSIGDRIFRSKGSEGSVKIEDEAQFKVNNLEIKTPKISADIGEKDTEVFFKKFENLEDFNKLYDKEQSLWVFSSGEPIGDEKLEPLRVFANGDDIKVDVGESWTESDVGKSLLFIGNGENLEFGVNGIKIKVDGEKTYVPSNTFELGKLKEFNGEIVVLNKNAKNTENGYNVFGQAITDIKDENKIDNKRVQIGGYKVFAHANLIGDVQSITAESINNPVTEVGMWEPQISEMKIYADEGQLKEFQKNHPEGYNAKNHEDFMKTCTSLKCNLLLTYDVDQEKIVPKIGKEITDLGLSRSLEKKAVDFKNEVFQMMGGDGAPKGTRIVVQTDVGESGKIVGGVFSIKLKGRDTKTLYLPGNFIQKKIEKGIQLIYFDTELIRKGGNVPDKVELPK